MKKKEIESKMIFGKDKEGHEVIQIVCGGKIGFAMGMNFDERWTGVDIDELVENIGVGARCNDEPIRKDTPTIRIVANDPNSYLVILQAFAKAYIVQNEINRNPDISKEELKNLVDGKYDLLVSDIKLEFRKTE